MKHLFMRMLFLVATVAAFGQSTARAELVNVSYAWSVAPSAVLSAGTGNVLISLTANDSTSFTVGTSTPIPGATITTASSASAASPDTFHNPFSLGLKLTEAGNTGTLTFNGTIAGLLTSDKSSLTGTFANPVQSIHLGTHIYQVTIDPAQFGLPSPVATSNTQIGAFILITNATTGGGNGGGNGGGGGTPQAPEPSSLVLGGMALAGIAARRWSRLKRQSA